MDNRLIILRWIISFFDDINTLTEALEPFADSVSSFLADNDKVWQVDALFSGLSPAEDLPPLLEALQERLSFALPIPERIPVPNVDWLAKNREDFPPFQVGGFCVCGTEDAALTGLIPIRIDAGTAFGSGRHETTYGCLTAIEQLYSREVWSSALDLGCGSGILAIAMEKRVPGGTCASDCDPESVRVTQQNAARNGVSFPVVLSDGFDGFSEDAMFDVIVANILSGPLIVLAPEISRRARRHIILSGLLCTQADDVLAAYPSWTCVTRRDHGQWCTLRLTTS